MLQYQAWNEQHRDGAPRKRPECINQLKRKRRRSKLPNTVTIDSIYEKNFLSLNSVLEAVIVDAFVLPGTLYCFKNVRIFNPIFLVFYIYKKKLK